MSNPNTVVNFRHHASWDSCDVVHGETGEIQNLNLARTMELKLLRLRLLLSGDVELNPGPAHQLLGKL